MFARQLAVNQPLPSVEPLLRATRQVPAAQPVDRRLLTLSPYGALRPTTGGTKRIFYLNRGYARAGWRVLAIASASIHGGIRSTIRRMLMPLLGPLRSEISPGYREELYFNPFVVLGNRYLRKRDAAQVASSILPRVLRPSRLMRRELARHRFVLFEHPQMFDMAEPFLRPDHFVILDAHNIESRLCPELNDPGIVGRAARALRDVERRCMRRADLVFTCSETDREQAIADYGLDPARVRVAPNGADLETLLPASDAERSRAKEALGLSGTTAIFMGSRWGPNQEAAEAVIAQAAQAPDMTWLIVGTVGDSLEGPFPSNVVVTGRVDSVDAWYAAADVALNPMTSGSGSNIKMFEYLAAGLPIVTTGFGTRGVSDPTGLAVIECPADALVPAVRALAVCPRLAERRRAARALAEESYDWTAIARRIIAQIEQACDRRRA